MTEQQHLGALFQNLYNGHPWIDVTLTGVLENIPAEKSATTGGSLQYHLENRRPHDPLARKRIAARAGSGAENTGKQLHRTH